LLLKNNMSGLQYGQKNTARYAMDIKHSSYLQQLIDYQWGRQVIISVRKLQFLTDNTIEAKAP